MKYKYCLFRIQKFVCSREATSKSPRELSSQKLSQVSTYFTISKASAAATPTWLPLKVAKLTVDS
jgi:hypothetical protein